MVDAGSGVATVGVEGVAELGIKLETVPREDVDEMAASVSGTPEVELAAALTEVVVELITSLG